MPWEETSRKIRELSSEELLELFYCWRFWARNAQVAPAGDWDFWLNMGGRGAGKTRSGAEWIREREEAGAVRIGLVARTAADARDVVVEGESGILATAPPWAMPRYEPSKRRLTWPARRSKGGSDLPRAVATTYSAEEPNSLRGPQHDTVWGDELAAWQHEAAFTNIVLGLRLGASPRALFTTTPRPVKVIRELLKDPAAILTRESTFANRANLPASFLAAVVRKYEGTRIGRQELYAEVLDDAPGSLWRRSELDAHRIVIPADKECLGGVDVLRFLPTIEVVAIGVDPATTSGEDSNLTGIVVAGIDKNGHGYVLEDASGRYTPLEWADKVASLYVKWKANRIVAEVNQGGDLVESNMRATRVKGPGGKLVGSYLYVTKVHAAKGKRTRAEPVAALYEQGRVHHVGTLADLETELCTWEPDVVVGEGVAKKVQKVDSPDRLDALVWALTDLLVENPPRVSGGAQAQGEGLDDTGIGV